MRKLFLLSLPAVGILGFVACVGDEPVTPGPTPGDEAGANDGATSSDGTTSNDGSATDGNTSTDGGDAGPPPCGYPGEICCAAPATPCRAGTTCGTGTPKRCLVNEVLAVGRYEAFTNGGFPLVNRIVTMKYDGATWTEGSRIDNNDSYPDSAAVGGPGIYRMVINKSGTGQYWFLEGVNWKDCSGAGTCAGPLGSLPNLYGITHVDNNFWLGGGNVIYRCVAPSRCVLQTTGLAAESWAYGNFSGPSEQDLWFSALSKAFHFDGTTWTVHPNLKARTIYQVRKNDTWVADTTFQHWDGATWGGELNVEGNPAPGFVTSIGGGAPDNLLAVGNGPGNVGFVLRYNGTEWKKDLTFPTTVENPQTIYAPSTIEAFTGGMTADGTGAIYKWNGTTWSKETVPALNTPANETNKSVRWMQFAGVAKPRP